MRVAQEFIWVSACILIACWGPGAEASAPPPAQLYTNQTVDHFSAPGKHGFFTQRYLVDDSFYVAGSDGPVYLLVGGEFAVEEWWTILVEPRALAASTGALIVALEHRHFGQSVPFGNLSMSSLEFLTIEQAIGDISKFIPWFSREHAVPQGTKWIAWGCSYSGVVSAYARLTIPDLVYATVASSAPVQPVVEFSAYNKVVLAAVNATVTGGSPECASRLVDAFTELSDMLKAPQGYEKLGSMFKACTPPSSQDDGLIERALLDLFIGSEFVQENLPTKRIYYLCRAMVSNATTTTPLQALAEFVTRVSVRPGGCYGNFDYAGYIASLRNTEVATTSWARQYSWLKCSQLGWFHTCSSETGCPFTPRVSLGHLLRTCSSVFNLSRTDVLSGVAATAATFGGNGPTDATRLLFVNGMFDPWHELSVTFSLPGNVPPVIISDGSHCSNCAAATPYDTPPVVEAREAITEQVEAWIRGDINVTHSGSV